ncbi:MAG: translocation/assembly module TamB domain-containing protein, partial [Chthoniobacterales bacterium]
MNRESKPAPDRRILLVGGLILVLGLAWLVHGPVLSELVRRAIPWVAGQSGYTATLTGVSARAFEPVRLTGLELTRPGGTRLQAVEVDLDWARWGEWDWSPSTWIRRAEVRGLSGRVAPSVATPESGGSQTAALPAAAPAWPRILDVKNGQLSFAGRGWTLDLRSFDLLLTTAEVGTLRIGELEAHAGQLERTFQNLSAVTAWRDGVAYFADLALDEHVVVDALSIALAGPPSLKLQARAGGGYVYADISGGGTETKAAVNALNLSLDGVAEFAGVDGEMEGTIDLAKLTFNGDPSQPLSGQMSLRIEAKDFAWRKNAVEQFTAGLSIAGRRIRLNECLLKQKANDAKLRGTLTLPPASADWREAPFDFEVDADIGDLRALTGLFGAPWNELSGGLSVEGQGSGKASDGNGWLKVRGWDLSARGIPSGTMQADLKLEGRDLKLTGLEAQSGPDFARGGGQLTLGDPLSYQGRFELRVREVSRYLARIGRFAPDWAREGGVLLFWDGDGTAAAHSGVATLELVRFTGDLNPVPVNGKLSASYSPGNIYVSRFLLDRGPLSLSSTVYFGGKGLTVQDIQMFSGRSRLLRGEMFLPLSLEAVLARQPWEQTLLEDGEVYAFVRSDNLDLESIVELFGQETTLRGKADLRLDASGPWRNAAIDGKLTIDGLRAAFPSLKIPDAKASLALQVKDRRAALDGNLQPAGSDEIKMQADLPLIGELPGGGWSLIDHGKPWTALLELAPTDLAKFAPAFSGAVLDRGTVSGKVQMAGTPSAPQAEGAIEWKDGRIAFPAPWQPMEDIATKLRFQGNEAVFEETRGRMGEGMFGLAGKIDFANLRAPQWEVSLRGENLKFYADENLALTGTPDLTGRGTKENGEVKGTLGLDGSAVLRSPTLAPRLVAAESSAASTTVSPKLTGPLSAWTLDLKMSSTAPIPVGADGADGLLAPDLYLQGTVAEPLLLGTLGIDRLQVSWPSGAKLAAAGRCHFTREKPWQPVLDLTGAGEAGPYDIRAGLFGLLDERKLLLSSAPPLTTEQIVLLLTTGVSPDPTAGAALAPLSAEQRMNTEPSWLDLDKVRGLLGWGTTAPDEAAPAEWSLGQEA